MLIHFYVLFNERFVMQAWEEEEGGRGMGGGGGSGCYRRLDTCHDVHGDPKTGSIRAGSVQGRGVEGVAHVSDGLHVLVLGTRNQLPVNHTPT